MSALENSGDFAFRAPLAITRDRTILDGHARWELAKSLRRTSLSCIEYDLPEAEALEWILRTHRQSSGLNAFKRISLALDLELFFQEKARANQRFGGQQKGSSKLTPAQRVDVRAQIASSAGVSTGNVSKVKELAMAAHCDVLTALHNDEVSIHRAWIWCKRSPRAQLQALWDYRAQKGVNRTIKQLIARHQPEISPQAQELSNLLRRLANIEPDELHNIGLAVIPAPGKAILVTEELLRAFAPQLELCATSNQ